MRGITTRWIGIAAAAAITTAPALAVDKTWIGDANGNFNDASHWTPAGVPGTFDAAIFNMGVVTPPYNVLFFTGFFQPINAVVDRVRIDSSPINFTIPTSTLTIDSTIITETGRALVIGRAGSGTPIARLDSLLSQLNTVYATLGADVGSDGTLNINGGTFNVTGTSAQFALIVGLNGGGVVNVNSGHAVDVAGNTVLGRNAGSSGFANVSGAATWSNGGSLNVGYAGQGTFNIASAGVVQTDLPAILGDQVGSIGDVSVSGTGSTWNITPSGTGYELTIGRVGTGSLDIGGGGDVIMVGDSVLAHQPGSTGSATIDGAGSQWIQQGELHVGFNGSGSIGITGGALLQTSYGYVGGYQSVAGNGQASVNISGANSHWNTTNGWISLGNGTPGSGAYGSITITSAGRITTTDCSIGNSPGSSGHAAVSGASSTLLVSGGDLYVGLQGDGTLNITGGGKVDVPSGSSTIGWSSQADGEVLVDGSQSKWDTHGALIVGDSGDATLAISGGGRVTSTGTSYVAKNAGSSGEITIDGAGSWWLINNSSAHLRIGDAGTATVTITNDGHLGSAVSSIGYAAEGIGQVDVDGLGSSWIADGPINVGYSGQGTLNITAAAHAQSDFGVIGFNSGSVGVGNVAGAGSIWTCIAFLIGRAGNGSLNVTDGGEVANSTALIGALAGSVGHVTVSGADSLWASTSNLLVGDQGHGVLDIIDGGHVISAAASISDDAGSSGAVIVSGAGSKWTNNSNLNIGNFANGTLNIASGGVVESVQVLVGVYGEIHGDGQIIGNVQSSGVIFPGTSPGALHIDGNYTQNTTGDIMIELASPSSYDQVLVGGNASLTGILTVDLIGGFVPSAGQTFTILTADDVDGEFTIINSPPGMLVTYTPTSVVISFPGSPCVPADLNCDGVVNTLDLGILLSSWTIPPQTVACGGALPCPADINHDGVVNTLDLGMLLSSWTL